MLRRFLFACAVIAASVPSAIAQDQMVPAPARGTTGNQCYEDCMQHYRDYNNMVPLSTQRQCAGPCAYTQPAILNQSPSCKADCTTAYNTCMANSPDPQNDRDCPINNLHCQDSCAQ